MQLPVIGYRGQVKPWGSIPRINWDHPLTDGLVCYGYDAGMGPIDLVLGDLPTIDNSARITGISPSKYGSGILYLGSGTVTQANAISLPTSDGIVTLTNTAPHSFGCGFMQTATGSGGATKIFTTSTTAVTFPICINTGVAGTTDFGFQFANGADNATALGLVRLNAFQSLLGVAVTGSTTACYVDGTLAISPAVTTTFTGGAGTKPTFSGTLSASQRFFTGYIYYAAFWKNRALTASEARLLHDDPYCFLIYPEDEMLASLIYLQTRYAAFCTPQQDPVATKYMLGY